MFVGAVLFFFVCISLAAVIPTPATEPHLTKSVSSSIPQVEPRHNKSSGQGGKIFASAQWEERSLPSGVRFARDPQSMIFASAQWEERALPSGVRFARDPQSTIFASAQWEERALPSEVRSAPDPESTIFKNHDQWNKPDVKHFPFSSLLFAHAQWEEERDNEHRPLAENDAAGSRNEARNDQKQQWKRNSASVELAESDVDKRNKMPGGPVFPAHVELEES
ncbi:hypothetical protein MSAN_00791500 [Mycena sanguinolenta]|uniref:Secreted protein n=1 Tax=Mycena sanguinolenta TaxID=230812 RepID=A0A8H6YYW9_9AGAR|nr:hypothetical protein MSAN_00791500 [Mycena sanguinolenta]